MRPFRKLIQASSVAPPPVQPARAERTYSKIKTDREPCRKFTQGRGVPYEEDLRQMLLKDGVGYQDLGSGYYDQFNKERKIDSYLKKLKALGWEPSVAMEGQPA